jgi:hypothetical protein
MTNGQKTAKQILDEVRLALGIQTEEVVAAGAAADTTPAAEDNAPAEITAAAKPVVDVEDNSKPIALADMTDTEATLAVINALCTKVWTLSNTISALQNQLSEASNAFYDAQRQAEAKVTLSEQKEQSSRKALTDLLALVEQLADLPTGEAVEVPADKKGTNTNAVERWAGAFKNLKQSTAKA